MQLTEKAFQYTDISNTLFCFLPQHLSIFFYIDPQPKNSVALTVLQGLSVAVPSEQWHQFCGWLRHLLHPGLHGL